MFKNIISIEISLLDSQWVEIRHLKLLGACRFGSGSSCCCWCLPSASDRENIIFTNYSLTCSSSISYVSGTRERDYWLCNPCRIYCLSDGCMMYILATLLTFLWLSVAAINNVPFEAIAWMSHYVFRISLKNGNGWEFKMKRGERIVYFGCVRRKGKEN